MTTLTHIKVTAYTKRSFTERIEKINTKRTYQEQVQDIIFINGLDTYENIVWDLCDEHGNVPEEDSSSITN